MSKSPCLLLLRNTHHSLNFADSKAHHNLASRVLQSFLACNCVPAFPKLSFCIGLLPIYQVHVVQLLADLHAPDLALMLLAELYSDVYKALHWLALAGAHCLPKVAECAMEFLVRTGGELAA